MLIRKACVAIGLGAMLAASVPVGAQDRREDRRERRQDRRDRHHRHGEDTIELGDTAAGIVVGALVIGGLAALFGGRKKPPVAPEPIPALVADADPERVASACAVATEAEGRRSFAIAQVGMVRELRPEPGGYMVSGDVLLRTGWQDPGRRRGFRCAVDAQAVRAVTIDVVDAVPPGQLPVPAARGAR